MTLPGKSTKTGETSQCACRRKLYHKVRRLVVHFSCSTHPSAPESVSTLCSNLCCSEGPHQLDHGGFTGGVNTNARITSDLTGTPLSMAGMNLHPCAASRHTGRNGGSSRSTVVRCGFPVGSTLTPRVTVPGPSALIGNPGTFARVTSADWNADWIRDSSFWRIKGGRGGSP